jgi:hypothetical protein
MSSARERRAARLAAFPYGDPSSEGQISPTSALWISSSAYSPGQRCDGDNGPARQLRDTDKILLHRVRERLAALVKLTDVEDVVHAVERAVLDGRRTVGDTLHEHLAEREHLCVQVAATVAV